MAMKQHFVIFYSPGTFVPEESAKPIATWDTALAMEMAKSIKERHSAVPYCFQFITKSRNDDDLDSKITDRSGNYFLGGRIETLKDVQERNDPKEETLRWNMEHNNIDRVLVNQNSWKTVVPFKDGDVLLESPFKG